MAREKLTTFEESLTTAENAAIKNVTNETLLTGPVVKETEIVVDRDPAVDALIEDPALADALVGSKVGDEITATGILAETVVKDEKKKAKGPHKTREQLEAEVAAARDDLGTTLDELVGKVTDLAPKNQARKLRGKAQHLALETLGDIKGFFAGEGMPEDPERTKRVMTLLKALGGVAGLIALRGILKAMRNHHTEHLIKKTAKKAAKQAVEHAENSTIIETGPIIDVEPGAELDAELVELVEKAARRHRTRKHRKH
jgi:hypothetical protein